MFVISVVDGAAIIICASASRESDGTYRDFEEASKIGNQNTLFQAGYRSMSKFAYTMFGKIYADHRDSN